MWSITVVQRTRRVIDIASLALVQNLENLPRTTSGKQNLLLERQVPVQTSVQALNTLPGYVQRQRTRALYKLQFTS